MMCVSFEPKDITLHMDVSEESDPSTRDEEVADDVLSSTQETWYNCVPDTMSSLCSLQYSEKFNFNLENMNRSNSIGMYQGQAKSVQCTSPSVRESRDVIDLTESSIPAHNHSMTGQNHNNRNNVEKVQKTKVTDSSCNSNPITNNVSANVVNTDKSTANQNLTKNNETKRPDVQNNMLKTITISSIRSINVSSNTQFNDEDNNLNVSQTDAVKKHDSLQQIPNISNEINTDTKGPPKSFDTNAGKQYPCLNVRVKPLMRYKGISYSTKCERHLLDKIAKELIQKSPAHLMEWSIVHGLIRPNQMCDKCPLAISGPTQMNLVQYTRESPYMSTGGYVWRCPQCSPASEKTIFGGSIFEKARYSPVTAFKLIYHWINHTDINCITSWVQVDRLYVKQFFTLIRAVCTSAVHEHLSHLGGVGKVVQVGIVSLKSVGDVPRRPVSILGILDQEKRLVRVQAVEPLKNGEKCTTEKMARILKPLATWIHKESIICTDYSINRNILLKMGFSDVYQVPKDNSSNTKYLNIEIQNYLKDDIPRIFKDSLFKLTRSVIQQFLEELTWREKWDESPLQTFNQIIKHIAEQTKVSEEIGLVNRLLKVSSEPFKDWNYKNINGGSEEVILLSDSSPTE